MPKPRVLITTKFRHPNDTVDRYLRENDFETIFNYWHGGRTEDEMISILRGIDGVIASSDPFTARVLNAADQLKVICREGVGYDAIDVDAATARGIVVSNTPGGNHHAVAEYAFALLLTCSRKIVQNLAEVRENRWTRHMGVDLAGKTLGIVGLGTIGKEVAQRARAFEMRVLAYDLKQDNDYAKEHQLAYVPLEQLLQESDFVTLHVFLSSQSRHMINAERLALMKPTAYLINASRGAVVDTEALIEALKEKRLAGAALDTFEQEPLPEDSPLRQFENVYLLPHAAGATTDAHDAMGMKAAENVMRVVRGEPPIDIVNPQVLNR